MLCNFAVDGRCMLCKYPPITTEDRMTDKSQQELQDSLHTAMSRCGSASQYFAMAWAKELNPNHVENWQADQALKELREAAEAMGFDLVKRQPKQEAA